MSDTPDPRDRRTVLNEALRALERMQARLDAMERSRTEPVAIIGMACRIPGGADDPEAFWRLLRDGVDAITEVPRDRWDVDAYYDPDPDAPGKMYTRWGGFLDRIDAFDPQFFGIAPREAVGMDPQHRLVLEVSWEALERAGLAPDRLGGSRTGVFIGIGGSEYGWMRGLGDPARVDAYHLTGTCLNFVAGRLSYVLGLRGPAMAVDTACSSSLVTVHLGCQSLRAGECDLALAGGVNLILLPDGTITTCRARMMAPDGRCKTFDARADGFVRAEGCGIVVLKRLSDALAAGDPILALIRGSAVNQDGRSSGLTVPNKLAQEDLIREALARAGVAPAEVSYVEAHGTGTSLGDPIEVRALAAALGDGRSAATPLLVGSVKTNIGHLEAAAGIAGLMKVVLALQHRAIPPHLHLKELNPYVGWREMPLRIPTVLTPWGSPAGRRTAGVSSFGASGTNAHVVVEEAPPPPPAPARVERPRHVVPLSAKSEPALRELAARCARHLEADADASLPDVGFTAGTGRAHFAFRVAVTAATVAEARARLAAVAAGETPPGVRRGQVRGTDRPKVAFLFTGQGSQYVGMGRELYETQPTFRAALERCDAILRAHLDVPLLSVLYPEPGAATPLDETAYTQPALFALEWALAELWRSWGVEPAVVLGHSVGEYVAACVAGVFCLEDGLGLIAARGRLMQSLPRDGAMAAVMAGEGRVAAVVAARAAAVSVAAVNGPDNVVISGARDAVDVVLRELEAEGVKTRRLNVSHAFHSPLMAAILEPFERVAAALEPRVPRTGLVSNVTGDLVRAPMDAGYWRRHARETVRFADGVATAVGQGAGVFVEIGPTATLLGMARRCAPEGAGLWLPSLRRGAGEWQQLLESLAALYVHGGIVDWAGFDRDYPRRKVVLPTYPFQRERCWPEMPAATRVAGSAERASAGRPTGHPLLGRRVRSPAVAETLFETRLGTAAFPFLQDHRVHGRIVVPATVYLEMVVAAAEALVLEEPVVEDLVIREALVLGEAEARPLQLVLAPADGGGFTFRVFSLADGELERGEAWSLHATGRVRTGGEGVRPDPAALAETRARCADALPVDEYYERAGAAGLGYGESFRGIEALWRRDGEALARVGLAPALAGDARTYRLHPALLDACLQALGAALAEPRAAAAVTYMPLSVERFQVDGRLDPPIWSHARVRGGAEAGSETLTADVRVYDGSGRVVVELQGLSVKRAAPGALGRAARGPLGDWFYEVAWRPKPLPAPLGEAPEYLARPPAIAERIRPVLARLAEAEGLSAYEGLEPALAVVSGAYVRQAFRRLGMDWALGRRVSAASLAEELGVAEAHRRLLGRLLGMLAEDGTLQRDGAEWEVRSVPEAEDAEMQRAALAARYAAMAPLLGLIGRCGRELARVLRGESDPVQLLFGAGSETAQVYQDLPFSRIYNTLVGEAIAAALARLPRGRLVRVLEIGAGTGGTTASVVPRLPADRTEYVFTDISAAFTVRTREKFREVPFIRYAVLDIERDPAAQGFEPHGFDVVLAANVLHATRDLRVTVGHVRRLLAPEGLAVLLEATAAQGWADLVFGLTEGWWRFADTDVRPGHPLVAPATWRALLEEAGFTDATAIPEDGAEDFSRQALVLARAPRAERHKDASASEAGGRWLVFADGGRVGDGLAERLRSRGEACVVVRPSASYEVGGDGTVRLDPGSPDDVHRLVRELGMADGRFCRGVVHLWSLDAADPDATTPASLRADVARGCGSVLHLVQALATAGGPAVPRLYVVTRGAQAVAPAHGSVAVGQAPVWGLGRVIAREHPELRCVRVDLDPEGDPGEIGALMAELASGDGEDQVALRRSGRYAARLVRGQRAGRDGGPSLTGDRPVRLVASPRGVLDNLRLEPVPRRSPGPGELEIRVRATGLNFRDVLNALGLYPGEPALGSEFAGTVVGVGAGVEGFEVGAEVVGLAEGCFGAFVTTAAQRVVPKPARLSAEDAAGIPVTFLTASYALHHLARMAAGERVLIHAAAGGVGLAAVQLARRAGAEVFATAGSEEKREFLRSLGVRHVMDSRSLAFADEVLARTGGRGVDIVLNSLTGEFIPKTLSVLGTGGRFLEVGRLGSWEPHRVAEARPDVAYFAIDLTRESPDAIMALLRGLMADFEAGALTPLPRRTFPLGDAVSAFRYMARAQHIGKIVVVQCDAAPPASGAAAPVRPDGTYLITGGLSGLGLRVAHWLVSQGARHLVLAGRRAPTARAREVLSALEAAGARVVVVQGDVSCEADVTRLLAEIAATMPPLRGVVHSAGVLDDGVLLQQRWERFVPVLAPKVEGSWHLHVGTRHAALDFFVLFSSATSLLGSPGQGNHAAANAFLDALAHRRRAEGLPAVSINWGAWAEIGAAAERAVPERIAPQGIGTIAPQQGLETLARAIEQDSTQVAVLPVDWSRLLSAFPDGGNVPFFSEMAREARRTPAARAPTAQPDLLSRLAEVPPSQQQSLLLAHVRDQVVRVLGLDPSRPPEPQQPLSELGLDSLMAVEVRNALGSALGRSLPATLLFDYPTVDALARYLARELSANAEGVTAAEAEPARGGRAGLSAELEQLSEAQMAALLAKKLGTLT